MTDERNDLIRIGDALDAITDWLCDEEFRHGIEPNRKTNKFFAKVMLENVPRLADRKTENKSEIPTGSTLSKMEQVDEPRTETKTETKNSNLTFEKQTDCAWK